MDAHASENFNDLLYHSRYILRPSILGLALKRGGMQGQQKQLWEELCAQAAVEQDPNKLMRLIEEINRLLAAKEERLANRRGSAAAE